MANLLTSALLILHVSAHHALVGVQIHAESTHTALQFEKGDPPPRTPIHLLLNLFLAFAVEKGTYGCCCTMPAKDASGLHSRIRRAREGGFAEDLCAAYEGCMRSALQFSSIL